MRDAAHRRRGSPSTTIRRSAALLYQVVLLAAVVVLRLEFVDQHHEANLARAKIASASASSDNTAGFDISQTLIAYSRAGHLRPRVPGRPAQHAAGRRHRHRARHDPRLPDRHRAAVAATGCVASSPRSTSRSIRNIPLLLQLFFWYFAVLKALPAPRESCRCSGSVFLNNRGLFCRGRCFERGLEFVGRRASLLGDRRRHRAAASGRRDARSATGQQFPVLLGRARPDRRGCRSSSSSLPACRSRSTIPKLRGFNSDGGIG